MSHPVNTQVQDEIAQGLWEIQSAIYRLIDYLKSKEDIAEFLTPLEVDFMNKVFFAVKSLEQGGGMSQEEFDYRFGTTLSLKPTKDREDKKIQ